MTPVISNFKSRQRTRWVTLASFALGRPILLQAALGALPRHTSKQFCLVPCRL